jgi:hypothetical protein
MGQFCDAGGCTIKFTTKQVTITLADSIILTRHEVLVPLYHIKSETDQANNLHTMTMQCVSFNNAQSRGSPGNTLFLPLTHHQAGFNAHSLLHQNASKHLQTRVQTIFESLPSLGFLPLLQSSHAPTLPPCMVFITGDSPPHVPSSFGIHAPMLRVAMGMSSIL